MWARGGRVKDKETDKREARGVVDKETRGQEERVRTDDVYCTRAEGYLCLRKAKRFRGGRSQGEVRIL